MGGFASPTAPRFAGPHKRVIEFIDSINEYKTLKNISDEYAVTNISLLLEEDALVWWNDVKGEIKTWNDFETLLCERFAPKKPNYVIYQEIMCTKKSGLPLEALIEQKLELFSQLPEQSEQNKLDMIYASIILQQYPIENKISRESVNTCDELLKAARNLLKIEIKNSNEKEVGNSVSTQQDKNEMRCAFCRFYGHTKEECRKLKKKLEAEATEPSTSGAAHDDYKDPGIKVQICSTPERTGRGRPVVFIEIVNIKDIGFIKTDIEVSFLSYRMYHLLVAKGHTFEETEDSVTICQSMEKQGDMYKTILDVTLEELVVPTIFYAFKKCENTVTFLGGQFVNDAKMVMQFSSGRSTWHVSGREQELFELYNEKFDDIVISVLEAHKVETQNIMDVQNCSPSKFKSFVGCSNRPVVFIEVGGVKEIGWLKTGIADNIMSHRMYQHLVAKGHRFEECEETLPLDLGYVQRGNMYKTMLIVTLGGCVIPTIFYVLRRSKTPLTYLGCGFVLPIYMQLGSGFGRGYFHGHEQDKFDIFNEGDVIVICEGQAYKAETQKLLERSARKRDSNNRNR